MKKEKYSLIQYISSIGFTIILCSCFWILLECIHKNVVSADETNIEESIAEEITYTENCEEETTILLDNQEELVESSVKTLVVSTDEITKQYINTQIVNEIRSILLDNIQRYNEYTKKYNEYQKQVMAQQAIEDAKLKEQKYINQMLDKASNVPNGEKGCKSQFKSWMRASSIKAKKSGQWKLLHSENCYEDPETKFMKYICEDGEERWCCAVGSYYTELIGTKINIIFQDGHMIKCILADQKADKDTDRSNRYHLCDGSVLEFVVGPNFKGDDTYPDWIYGKIHYVDVLEAVNDGKGFEWD